MRIIAACIALSFSVPALAAVPAQKPRNADDPRCISTRSYVADMSGMYRGKPLTPRKLNELPPATAYMAVFRHIGGCEAPMTMIEYRGSARR